MAKLKKCAHCGKMFKPEKASQNYCSLECAEQAIAKQKQWNDVLQSVANVIELEYLTFSKAATLMGCSRQYVYKLVADGKLPASRLSNRMSFIKRADIEKMLEGNPYYRVIPVGTKKAKKTKNIECTVTDNVGTNDDESFESNSFGDKSIASKYCDDFTDITDLSNFVDADMYITLEQAMAKYVVSNTTIYNRVRDYRIPTCRISGKTYYNRVRLDEVMKGYGQTRVSSHSSKLSSGIATPNRGATNTIDTEINLDNLTIIKDEGIEWLWTKDCEDLYRKTCAAMKTFVHRYEIPAKWINGKRYYSKTHLDAMLASEKQDDRYYTTSEMYTIYGINKSTMSYFCRKKGIRSKRVNRRVMYLKEDVDKVMVAERR